MSPGNQQTFSPGASSKKGNMLSPKNMKSPKAQGYPNDGEFRSAMRRDAEVARLK